MTTYQTPQSFCQAVYDIKKSKFLAFAYPITQKDEIMFHVEQLRKCYPDARHVCYGYIIGNPNNTTHAGFDDDGEPNGTAGRPILNVLQHKAIGNVLVAVVRYFGGIKLGAGGLTRAYATTTQLVVDEMTLIPFIPQLNIQVISKFGAESYVRHVADSLNATITKVSYGEQVTITLTLAQVMYEDFIKQIGRQGTVKKLTKQTLI